MLIIALGWGDSQCARFDGRQLRAKVKIRLQLSILFLLIVLLLRLLQRGHWLATATLLNSAIRYVVERIVLLLGHHKESMRRLIAEEDLIGVPLPRGHRRLTRRTQHHRAAVIAADSASHSHAREIGALPHAAGGGATCEVLGAVAYAHGARIAWRLRSALHGSRWRGGAASGRTDAIAKVATVQSRATSSQHIQQLALSLLRRALCGNRRAIAACGPVCGGLLGNHICKCTRIEWFSKAAQRVC